MNETPEYPTLAHGTIPSFQNYEDEACFWDTHDFTDFSQETPISQCPINSSTAGLTKQRMIRLDEETDHTLEVIAADIKKATLVRKILRAWLHQQQAERHAS